MEAAKKAYRKVQPFIPAALRNVGELHLWRRNYLWTTGWMRSRRQKMAVDADGRPLPWYTYPSIRFLEGRIPPRATVFEFGMGNSTLWWSGRTQKVVTCESDEGWFRRIAAKMPPNVEAMVHPAAGDAYVNAAADLGEAFDILVIDGRRRVECCANSLKLLSEDGVVIWDNADRERYRPGYEMLRAAGFRSIAFWGLSPMNIKESCTSIFYRSRNCLGI